MLTLLYLIVKLNSTIIVFSGSVDFYCIYLLLFGIFQFVISLFGILTSLVAVASAGNEDTGRFTHHSRQFPGPFGRDFNGPYRNFGHRPFSDVYRGTLRGHGPGGYHHGYDRGDPQYGREYRGNFYGPPPPYEFAYNTEDGDGAHGHSQVSDGRGVRGQYTIQLADGRSRRVDYVADEGGFRAKVDTNEPGTESKDAADAEYRSTAIPGPEAAIRFGPGPNRYATGPAYGPHHGGPGKGFGLYHHGGYGHHHRGYNRW